MIKKKTFGLAQREMDYFSFFQADLNYLVPITFYPLMT